MSMTRTRNIRDVQVNRRLLRSASVSSSALAASCDQLPAAGGVGRTRRTLNAETTPRGVDCGYRVPHLARQDSSRTICATADTALL